MSNLKGSSFNFIGAPMFMPSSVCVDSVCGQVYKKRKGKKKKKRKLYWENCDFNQPSILNLCMSRKKWVGESSVTTIDEKPLAELFPVPQSNKMAIQFPDDES